MTDARDANTVRAVIVVETGNTFRTVAEQLITTGRKIAAHALGSIVANRAMVCFEGVTAIAAGSTVLLIP